MYAILSKTGEFLRAESNPQRAERAGYAGLRAVELAVQQSDNGFVGICAEGTLTVSPGKKEWQPKSDRTESRSKKIDTAADSE